MSALSKKTSQQELTLAVEGQILPVLARINRRARRYIIRVDSVKGVVHITAPSKRSLPEALRFARSRQQWILQELRNGPSAKPFYNGGLCPYRGLDHPIEHVGGVRAPTRLKIEEGSRRPAKILVGGDLEHINRRVVDWLKRQARQVLTERSDFYCEQLGVKRGSIRVGDTKSRWGSCSQEGTISYSWRLILTPPPILNYVAAHECAHMVEDNHSAAFWAVCDSINDDVKKAKKWLRANGAFLHAVGAEW